MAAPAELSANFFVQLRQAGVPANPHPVNQAFIAAYRTRYNAAPNPDREQIREQIATLKNVPVPIGDNSWSMDAQRNANYGGAVLVVKCGAFTAAP